MTDMINRHEKVVEMVRDRIVEKARSLQDAIGPRPFGTEKLSEAEQVQRYLLIREDPAAWQALLDDPQKAGPKRTLEYAQRMEKLLARHPEQQPEQATWSVPADPAAGTGETGGMTNG